MRERLAVAAEHQAAGRLAIEPVREFRPARQAVAQRVEPVFQARPALRPAMHRETGGLVDHQHQPVAMKHAREDFLLARVLRIERLGQRFHVHRETAITAANMNDTPKQSWFAAPLGRAEAHLLLDRQRDLRSRLEAQARCRDDRGAGRAADPRRSRRRCFRAHRGGDRRRPLRQAGERCGGEDDPRHRSREGARARREADDRSMQARSRS